jgi:glycerol-3-phosphate dehydrogenase (NAD+)
MRVRSDGPQLISQLITKYLAIDCSVLMGANIAGDIGREQLSEAVIGYSNPEHAKVREGSTLGFFHVQYTAGVEQAL